MIEDILNMLKNLRERSVGKMFINWPSNSFACKWDLKWGDQILNIKSEWYNVNGHIENLLNNSNEINIEINLFMNEWKKILKILIDDLKQCGYNENNLAEMKWLIEEYQNIDDYGVLYKI